MVGTAALGTPLEAVGAGTPQGRATRCGCHRGCHWSLTHRDPGAAADGAPGPRTASPLPEACSAALLTQAGARLQTQVVTGHLHFLPAAPCAPAPAPGGSSAGPLPLEGGLPSPGADPERPSLLAERERVHFKHQCRICPQTPRNGPGKDVFLPIRSADRIPTVTLGLCGQQGARSRQPSGRR